MEYVEAILTLIVIFVVPAVIVAGIVGARDPSRGNADHAVRTPDQPQNPHA